MIIGPDVELVRERAKAQVMNFLVAQAEQDGTPPTLRALYVMKAAHADTVLAGGSSALIEGEAELRGWTPFQMATVISEMAAESALLELTRMRLNVDIENAQTEHDIVTILDTAGIKFHLEVEQ